MILLTLPIVAALNVRIDL